MKAGTARSTIDPEGQVWLQGTVWGARLANAAPRARIVEQDFPGVRLRITLHAGHGNDVIDVIAVQSLADRAQRFISSGSLLRQRGRGRKQ